MQICRKFSLIIILSVASLTACQTYVSAYRDLSFENEIASLGFKPVFGSLSESVPGSIVAARSIRSPWPFDLLCGWNEVLIERPSVRPFALSARAKSAIVDQYASLLEPTFRQNSSDLGYFVQSMEVVSAEEMYVSQSQLFANDLEKSCLFSIKRQMGSENSLFAVLGISRAYLDYKLVPTDAHIEDVASSFRQREFVTRVNVFPNKNEVIVSVAIVIGVKLSDITGNHSWEM